MVKRQFQRGTLFRLYGKARRLGNALRGHGLQLPIQRGQIPGIFGFQQAKMLTRKTQPGEDGLRRQQVPVRGRIRQEYFASQFQP